jgi:hypothetical protein
MCLYAITEIRDGRVSIRDGARGVYVVIKDTTKEIY